MITIEKINQEEAISSSAINSINFNKNNDRPVLKAKTYFYSSKKSSSCNNNTTTNSNSNKAEKEEADEVRKFSLPSTFCEFVDSVMISLAKMNNSKQSSNCETISMSVQNAKNSTKKAVSLKFKDCERKKWSLFSNQEQYERVIACCKKSKHKEIKIRVYYRKSVFKISSTSKVKKQRKQTQQINFDFNEYLEMINSNSSNNSNNSTCNSEISNYSSEMSELSDYSSICHDYHCGNYDASIDNPSNCSPPTSNFNIFDNTKSINKFTKAKKPNSEHQAQCNINNNNNNNNQTQQQQQIYV